MFSDMKWSFRGLKTRIRNKQQQWQRWPTTA